MAVRDRLIERWVADAARATTSRTRSASTTCPPSSCSGRALGNNLINLGLLRRRARGAARARASTSTTLLEQEPDAGLGNGGLGRLAACFLDSLATLGMPGYRLRHPLRVRHLRRRTSSTAGRSSAPTTGCSSATPGRSSARSTRVPVQLRRPRRARTDDATAAPRRAGSTRKTVLGVPYDTPIAGYGNDTVNTLRLWQARAVAASSTSQSSTTATTCAPSRRRTDSENISKVLYPNDHNQAGQGAAAQAAVLLRRLLASRDIVRRYLKTHTDVRRLRRQGRDPAQRHAPGDRDRRADARARRRAAARLGRGLGDHQSRRSATRTTRCCPRRSSAGRWRCSSGCCRATCRSSTRSTTASCARCRSRYPGDDDAAARACRSSRRAPEKQVRMAHLAVVGSHSVNGVAALHTELLKRDVLPRLRTSCGRSGSTTRPTASRRGAGSCSATRGSPR